MENNHVDIPTFIRTTFSDALLRRASDVHIDPGMAGLQIRFRVDGSIQDYTIISMEFYEQVLMHLKVLASLNTSALPTPQDGRFAFNFNQDDPISHQSVPVTLEVRISVFPTIHGDAAVCRISSSISHIFELQNLGMNDQMLEKMKKIIKKNNGMLLITGPVGSGKTSILYSILNEVISQDKSAITLEDPVEFSFNKARQVQMNPERGFDYAAGMRSILRQDPDIIMIGEIRDAETAEYAVRVALVGRTVFSTIHANSGVGTIARLIDMKIEKSLVAYALNGVVSSRLVKKNCENCKEEYVPSQEYISYFDVDLSGYQFYKGRGCDICDGKGYLGRVGVFEVLEFDTMLRSLIVEGASMAQIQKYVDTAGMKSLKDDALEKVLSGVIAIENVVTVI